MKQVIAVDNPWLWARAPLLAYPLSGCRIPGGFHSSGSDLYNGHPCSARGWTSPGHLCRAFDISSHLTTEHLTHDLLTLVGEHVLQLIMLGHVGHQIRLSALRTRPRVRSHASGNCLHHEPQRFNSKIRLQVPSQRRHFGVADVAGGLIKTSEFLVTNIHEVTGTPWFISIPLVALVVGAAIRMPMTLYSHSMARKRARLMPLIQAQTAMTALGLRKKKVPNLMERVSKAMKKHSKDTLQAFAISERTSIIGGLLSLPLFVSNIEVIRRMCGGPKGLLGSLIFGAPGAETTEATTTEPAEAVSASSTVGEVPWPTGLSDLTASSTQSVLPALPLDPTLATGGCLWFPDLLASDPYHILPFAVSAMLALHMIPETSAARRELFGLQPVAGNRNATLYGQTRGRRAFQRTMLIMALAIGPITMDMPVALHLYWLTSAGFGLVVSKGIKMVMPLPKNTIKPCRGLEIPLLRPKPT